jgi:cyclic beta-1,2-glucan synthetase
MPLGEINGIRTNDLKGDRLASFGFQLGSEHKISKRKIADTLIKDYPLLERITQLEEFLLIAYKRLTQSGDLKGPHSHAAEWLLDNFYLVEEAFLQIREDFPKKYYQKLPLLSNTDHHSHPRVLNLAWVLLSQVDFNPNPDQITRFVIAYQHQQKLKISEIWAIPIMLRIGILEVLTQVISRITDVSLPTFGPQVEQTFGESGQRNLVANCIQGLRTLKNLEWKVFFENVSLVEVKLNEDPSGVYPEMTFDTRDQYRKAIEQLAQDSGISEEKVASLAVDLAKDFSVRHPFAQDPADRIQTHVGYYLVERGLSQLINTEDFSGSGYTLGWAGQIKRGMSDHALLLYVGSILLIIAILLSTLLLSLDSMNASLAQELITGILAIIPASVVAVNLVNVIVSYTIPPRNALPRMDFSNQAGGIPEAFRTLVVIPALLSNSEQVVTLLRQIKLYYLANNDVQTFFALLTDFPDADTQHLPEDKTLLDQVANGIRELNDQYKCSEGDNFFLIHRDRQWNPVVETWMGWERKRGKLIQLNRLLKYAADEPFSVIIGDTRPLKKVKFVLTLDEDTVLPNNTVRELAGTLAHPFNRPQFDPVSGRVTAGYTFLQPRLEVKPEAARKSWFTRIFIGDGGVDLYSQVVSDIYQDLFAEGNYMGKGIYDLDAFIKSLDGQIPENAVLSHDLLEGIYARAGLVTDVVLFEDYPLSFLEYVHRLHRWVRGDWQLLPWLFSSVGILPDSARSRSLTPLGTWKLIDNLRRSLAFPAILAFLLLGWLWLPGPVLLWTSLTLALLALPLFTGMLPHVWHGLKSRSLRNMWQSTRFDILHWFLNIVFLPYQSLVMLDAIGRTLLRLMVTQKNLLQWTTASQTRRLFSDESKAQFVWARMWLMVLFVAVLILLISFINPKNLIFVFPILVLWLLSPQIAHWINRPPLTIRSKRLQEQATGEQEMELRKLTRRTWLFFEQFVGPEDHWLPPDHFQEKPRGTVAHRTSPTNIGLGLLSIVAAYDNGYIGAPDLSVRTQNTLNELNKMEKYSGHLLNWYETQSLKPLPPRYVSTVDSGNFAGCLLALKEGLVDVRKEPVIRSKDWQGLLVSVKLLQDSLLLASLDSRTQTLVFRLDKFQQEIIAVIESPDKWFNTLDFIIEHYWKELNEQILRLFEHHAMELESESLSEMRTWMQRVHQNLMALLRTFNGFLPWLAAKEQFPTFFIDDEVAPALLVQWNALTELFTASATLKDIDHISTESLIHLVALQKKLDEHAVDRSLLKDLFQESDLQEWCHQFTENLRSASRKADQLLSNIQEMIDQTESLFDEMDFRFLYNEQRNLFRIGYNIDTGKLDENHYDLLASEARLASLIAIATGDVPQKHWLYLGRPLTGTKHGNALISWSGSMFEFLMPHLLVRRYPNTLIDLAINAAVDIQIDYCHSKGIPWGISESGFYHFDANMNYQYRAFGVPGLGLKRGLDVDLVIAPYASVLALSVRPQAVIDNISQLRKLGMSGLYGFYEAMDFTDTRLPLAKEFAPILSFMAHHQGMIMLSLTNFLENDPMIRRFHADPRIENFVLLLHEQIPANPRLKVIEEQEIRRIQRPSSIKVDESWSPKTNLGFPSVHFLSNGMFGSLITSNGGGFIQYLPAKARREDPMMVTRWQPDTTLDKWGIWIYVQDLINGSLWSAGLQPTGALPETCKIDYYPHQVVFNRRDESISTQTSITISPDDDVEIRKVALVNHQNDIRHLRITSYGEVVLSDQNSDRRHPAFNKLFVHAEFLPQVNAILFHRRPRSNDEAITYLVHMLTVKNPSTHIEDRATIRFECDRRNFIGRWHSPRDPVVMNEMNGIFQDSLLSDTDGFTLDPIMALSFEVELNPRETQEMAFITFVSSSRRKAIALADHYQLWPRIERTFEKSAAANQSELDKLNIGVSQLEVIQQLLSLMYYPDRALRESAVTLTSNQAGQSGLWAHAISGDYPVVLGRVGLSSASVSNDIDLVKDLVRAHSYWRKRGIMVDLVILDQSDQSYDQDLRGDIQNLITQLESDRWINKRGGIFLLQGSRLKAREIVLFETVARAVFDSDKGTFEEQVKSIPPKGAGLPGFLVIAEPFAQTLPDQPLLCSQNLNAEKLLFDNGLGGFSPDGKEYVIHLEPGNSTPSPWINVIANPDFGCITSAAGMGCTWAVNSGENRLTPWWSDPVSEPPSEVIYIRNEETGEFWCPTPLPVRSSSSFHIHHGAGYSIYEHISHGLEHQLRIFIDPVDPVKIATLKLKNNLNRRQLLTITYYVDWVLGTDRVSMSPFIVPEFNPGMKALLARNRYNQEFKERIAFLATNSDVHEFSADRSDFLGLNGSYSNPESLTRVGLSGTVTPGPDPCAALRIFQLLEPGESREVFFFLGQGKDHQETMSLIERFQDIDAIESSWDEIRKTWTQLTEAVQVQTPDQAMDLMMNQWLLYQTLSCRIWGRSALYQSSGAYGFRDQLQDVMALVHSAPELTREHILQAARHQFEEGDVLHWWHPPSGRGIRTRCSDNMLWLPFVTSYYIKRTGDESILWEEIPFLSAQPLRENESERYDYYETAGKKGTLFEHCRLALDHGITQGRHGLPLIGSHDWNDGMNQVGIGGEGESVWLGWFLCAILKEFVELIQSIAKDENRIGSLDSTQMINRYIRVAESLRHSLEEHAWDGAWYKRAFFDDGAPLGTSQNLECQIDSIAQSWAVISAAADPARASQAMRSVEEKLVNWNDSLVLLFTPPFEKTHLDPGYIKSYPPGIRENGGQYTHAALWATMAFAYLGESELAWKLFKLLNPLSHSDGREKINRYRVEPYVVAADVYSTAPHTGQGGWTWYTGSAGWMYQVGLEVILGLKRMGDHLQIDPNIPNEWAGFSVQYQYGGTTYFIRVDNSKMVNQGVIELRLDGEVLSEKFIQLRTDNQEHTVDIIMG